MKARFCLFGSSLSGTNQQAQDLLSTYNKFLEAASKNLNSLNEEIDIKDYAIPQTFIAADDSLEQRFNVLQRDLLTYRLPFRQQLVESINSFSLKIEKQLFERDLLKGVELQFLFDFFQTTYELMAANQRAIRKGVAEKEAHERLLLEVKSKFKILHEAIENSKNELFVEQSLKSLYLSFKQSLEEKIKTDTFKSQENKDNLLLWFDEKSKTNVLQILQHQNSQFSETCKELLAKLEKGWENIQNAYNIVKEEIELAENACKHSSSDYPDFTKAYGYKTMHNVKNTLSLKGSSDSPFAII